MSQSLNMHQLSHGQLALASNTVMPQPYKWTVYIHGITEFPQTESSPIQCAITPMYAFIAADVQLLKVSDTLPRAA
jgi:hypothetical protein